MSAVCSNGQQRYSSRGEVGGQFRGTVLSCSTPCCAPELRRLSPNLHTNPTHLRRRQRPTARRPLLCLMSSSFQDEGYTGNPISNSYYYMDPDMVRRSDRAEFRLAPPLFTIWRWACMPQHTRRVVCVEANDIIYVLSSVDAKGLVPHHITSRHITSQHPVRPSTTGRKLASEQTSAGLFPVKGPGRAGPARCLALQQLCLLCLVSPPRLALC